MNIKFIDKRKKNTVDVQRGAIVETSKGIFLRTTAKPNETGYFTCLVPYVGLVEAGFRYDSAAPEVQGVSRNVCITITVEDEDAVDM